MTNIDDKTPDSQEDQIRQLQKERNRLQRTIKRYETQLQHLDKMASANERTNIALYKELEVLQQQTEAQTREAQIEAALERVRARSMAMHHTSELQEIIHTVHEELLKLNISIRGGSFVVINDDIDTELLCWGAGGTANTSELVHVPHFGMPFCTNLINRIKQGPGFFTEEFTQNEKKEYFTELFKQHPWSELSDTQKKETLESEGGYTRSCCVAKHTSILIINQFGRKFSDEENDILKRFGKVFEQSYTRFLDLQKAEAQTREAQIEVAIERVRAQSMAMHQPDDLDKVNRELLNQLTTLEISGLTGVSFYLVDPDEIVTVWDLSSPGNMNDPNSYTFKFDSKKHPVMGEFVETLKSTQEDYFILDAPKEKLLLAIEELQDIDIEIAKMFKNAVASGALKHQWNPSVRIKNGMLSVDLIVPPNEEIKTIVLKMGGAFNLAYQRFLDLQKAQAQAREAQIEAALERVRSRAIAMRHSDELSEAAELLYQEFLKFGVESFSCGYLINDDEKAEWKIWLTNPGEKFFKEFWTAPYAADHNLRARYESWKRREAFHCAVLEGEENRAHHVVISKFAPWKAEMLDSLPPRLVFNSAHFSLGHLLVISPERLAPELEQAMVRFAGVFDLAYRRFLDLQKAEARAREAEQQASLDRVRAEIASMRTAADLQRITPLIWRELTTLGVPFFRCGVFIIDEATEQVHVYLSTPTGEAVAALHLKFDSAPVVEAAVQHWRQQQVYREEWNRERFIAWTQSILKQGLIDSPEKYQGGDEAPEKLVLQFMPFTQGMLYIGSSAALSADEIELSQAIAKAFGMAYARYEDFQKLEAAKAQVEAALENLKKTQQQLVTQQKLASLGQLTAGIAHEIKNPLNFVNNFAALSVDLAKELREEIAKVEDGGLKSEDSGSRIVDRESFANIDEIIETLIQNAEKINHHGKRADGIVKSMMQHARGSSGQRELADINHLLDEAVNLTYHGMRANEASFNITIEKDYDETIGKLNVVPQDLSRVFLNISNNACYAAFQKQKANGPDISIKNTKGKSGQTANFPPTLSVRTKNLGDKIEIRIRDNGNGIPAEVREKIFNPFFTTKPTGQGTGLGLSISYDIIVQEHRGEINVETEEGKFTEFVIRLPRS